MLYVKDLPRMASFYAGTLGLKAIESTRTESWLEFESGFALHAIPPHIAAEIEITTPPEVREESPMKVFFAVPDVASERRRLESLGVTIVQRPWSTPSDPTFDAIDPEGNVFTLCS